MFESQLLGVLDGLDPSRPVVVEAESSKVGERMVPPALWQAMVEAPRIELAAPTDARARYLVEASRDIALERTIVEAAFDRLPTYPGRKRLDDWKRLFDEGAWTELALALIEHHYDPAYRRWSRKNERPTLARLELPDVGPAELARAAEAVAKLVEAEAPVARA